MLTQSSADVKVCATVTEVLKAIEQSVPDIIISDIAMPDEDGCSFINKVRELFDGRDGLIPAIAVTRHTPATRPASRACGRLSEAYVETSQPRRLSRGRRKSHETR